MANFILAIPTVLRNEGGYANIPADPGGPTNFGISLKFYRTIKSDATEKDIKDLTEEMATAIYSKCFWMPNKYNLLADQRLATKALDMSVLMGGHMANKCLQRAVLATENRNIDQDGIIGIRTLAAVNMGNPDALMAAFKSECAGYYRGLAEVNHDLKIFLPGWLTRAYSSI